MSIFSSMVTELLVFKFFLALKYDSTFLHRRPPLFLKVCFIGSSHYLLFGGNNFIGSVYSVWHSALGVIFKGFLWSIAHHLIVVGIPDLPTTAALQLIVPTTVWVSSSTNGADALSARGVQWADMTYSNVSAVTVPAATRELPIAIGVLLQALGRNGLAMVDASTAGGVAVPIATSGSSEVTVPGSCPSGQAIAGCFVTASIPRERSWASSFGKGWWTAWGHRRN